MRSAASREPFACVASTAIRLSSFILRASKKAATVSATDLSTPRSAPNGVTVDGVLTKLSDDLSWAAYDRAEWLSQWRVSGPPVALNSRVREYRAHEPRRRGVGGALDVRRLARSRGRCGLAAGRVFDMGGGAPGAVATNKQTNNIVYLWQVPSAQHAAENASESKRHDATCPTAACTLSLYRVWHPRSSAKQ